MVPIKDKPLPSKIPPATSQVLSQTQAYSFETDYIMGPDGWHLRAKSGDDVIVSAWVEDMGIAYNL